MKRIVQQISMKSFYAALLTAFFFNLANAEEELLVATSAGMVQGHYNTAGIREWKGIPYSRPPVGALRWQYPQEPDNFDGTFIANYNAPGCQQICKLPPGNCPEYGQSEDCLYLTVMAPTAAPPADGYPVMFWIHGG